MLLKHAQNAVKEPQTYEMVKQVRDQSVYSELSQNDMVEYDEGGLDHYYAGKLNNFHLIIIVNTLPLFDFLCECIQPNLIIRKYFLFTRVFFLFYAAVELSEQI